MKVKVHFKKPAKVYVKGIAFLPAVHVVRVHARPVTPAPAEYVCSHCGAFRPDGKARFCSNCGARMG